MRLLTHNMLQCPRTRSYPLELQIETCDEVQVDYSAEFVLRMVPRLNWGVFLAAARQLPDEELVARLPEGPPGGEDDDVLRAVHRALLQWHVVEGALVAEGTSYRVSNGVPNLVITEVRKGNSEDHVMAETELAAEEEKDDANGPAA